MELNSVNLSKDTVVSYHFESLIEGKTTLVGVEPNHGVKLFSTQLAYRLPKSPSAEQSQIISPIILAVVASTSDL